MGALAMEVDGRCVPLPELTRCIEEMNNSELRTALQSVGRDPGLDAELQYLDSLCLERKAKLNVPGGRSGVRFYHGGPRGLRKGDRIFSSSDSGIRAELRPGSRRQADLFIAVEYAAEGRWKSDLDDPNEAGAVYRVKPIGPVEPDLEYIPIPGVAWMAEAAVVEARMPFTKDEAHAMHEVYFDVAGGSLRDSSARDRARDALNGPLGQRIRPRYRREYLRYVDLPLA